MTVTELKGIRKAMGSDTGSGDGYNDSALKSRFDRLQNTLDNKDAIKAASDSGDEMAAASETGSETSITETKNSYSAIKADLTLSSTGCVDWDPVYRIETGLLGELVFDFTPYVRVLIMIKNVFIMLAYLGSLIFFVAAVSA